MSWAVTRGDALGVDVLEIDEGAEGQRGQDLQLVGRVHPLDVERRIGLGIAVGLGFLEDQREVEPLVGHLAQDVVAGAVDDAGQRQHPVGDQAFLDRADQRDAAGHRRLEAQRHAVAARRLVELGAVVGEQRLVGRHHVLAGGQRAQDEGARRLEAADQLDHDVDGGIGEDPRRVVGHRQRREVEPLARADEVGVGDRPPRSGARRSAPAASRRGSGGSSPRRPRRCRARAHRYVRRSRRSRWSRRVRAQRLRCLSPRRACRIRCSFSTSAKRT